MSVTLGDLIENANAFSGKGLQVSESRLGRNQISNQTMASDNAQNYPVGPPIVGPSVGPIDPDVLLVQKTPIQNIYPLNSPPSGSYAPMPLYNSNYVANPVNYTVPPSIPQKFINQYTGSYVNTPAGPIAVPRQIPPSDYSDSQQRALNYYGTFSRYPPYAGAVPDMKNAIAQDGSVAMNEPRDLRRMDPRMDSGMHDERLDEMRGEFREGYQGHRFYDYDCIRVLRHLSSCPMCMRHFKCDNRVYIIMILSLVLLFVIVLFLILKK
jgi:hypothetical protein